MQEQLMAVIKMLHKLFVSSQLKVSQNRNRTDLFASRVLKNASAPNLLKFANGMIEDLQCELGSMGTPEFYEFQKVANSEDGLQILEFVREYPELFAVMVATKKEDWPQLKDAIQGIEIPQSQKDKGQVRERSAFDIPIKFTTLSNFEHGSDKSAGNAKLFRRTKVRTKQGYIVELPFFGGNSFRGQMRDLLTKDYFGQLGLKWSSSKPPVEMWMFYVLSEGGGLDGKKEAIKEIGKHLDEILGKNGAQKIDGIDHLRNMIPPLSILGAALATRSVDGRIMVADSRPRCYEWGTGDAPVHTLFDWTFATKHEDFEGHKENTSMIYDAEIIVEGVVFDGGIDVVDHMTDIERSCLGRGLELMQKHGHLGGGSRRGHGKVEFEFENLPNSKPYEDYMSENREKILKFLEDIGAIKKGLF